MAAQPFHYSTTSPSASSPLLGRSAGSRRSFLFHPYELELETGRLCHHGKSMEIQAQPRRLLTLLVTAAVSRPGEVVTHKEIRDCLWGDSHVDAEQGIRFAIRQVRRTLGDDATAPRFVSTEVGEGYRFIAPVEVRAVDPSGTSRLTDRSGSWGPELLQRLLVPSLLILATLLTGTTAWMLPATPSRVLVAPFDGSEAAGGGSTDGESSDGIRMAEEVRIALGRILKDKAYPFAPCSPQCLDQAGSGSAAVMPDFRVEGAIQPTDRGLRVTARLVDSRTGTQLWSTAYEHREPSDLPEVARWIAEAVGLHFTGTRPRAAFPVRRAPDSEVARLYDRARELIEKNLVLYNPKAEVAILEAHGLLERALKIDPAYPVLHLELARIHVWRGEGRHGPMARAARMRGEADLPTFPNEGLVHRHLHAALVLDQQLETAWALYGMQALFRDLDLEAAEGAIERALALDPGLPYAYYLRGTVRTVDGRATEAAESLLRALALDPGNMDLHLAVGEQLFYLKRYDEARRVFRRVDELLRRQGRGYIECMTCLELLVRIELIEQKDAETALAHARREMARMREVGEDAPFLDAADPQESLERYWRWWLGELPQDCDLVERAALHLALGERREALTSLRRVPLHREDRERIFLRRDPRFDELRDDPEFGKIVEAVFDRGAHRGSETALGARASRGSARAHLWRSALGWLPFGTAGGSRSPKRESDDEMPRIAQNADPAP